MTEIINLNRKYLTRWSPLDMTLISKGDLRVTEQLNDFELRTNVPNAIFQLPETSMVLITMDLRHILKEYSKFTYGEDWAISFTLKSRVTL